MVVIQNTKKYFSSVEVAEIKLTSMLFLKEFLEFTSKLRCFTAFISLKTRK